MKALIAPILLLALCACGGPKYVTVDLKFVQEIKEASLPVEERAALLDALDGMVYKIASRNRSLSVDHFRQGSLVVVQARKCDQKRYQKVIDAVRVHYGLAKAAW
ncbi:MAG: hypothetical protein IPP26_11925 [Flavobacteriales bacterium]|nr:hypothetical protein [Flavobacteriales bacterium]